MAGVKAALTTSVEIALVAATAKTVLQLTAATNHRVIVVRIGISFDGSSTTDEPVNIQIVRQTTAGTMTVRTPVKRGYFDETLQTTGAENATAEPTATDVLDTFHVHPQQGFDYWLPIGEEIHIKGGDRLGIKVTAPANVNCLSKMWFEE